MGCMDASMAESTNAGGSCEKKVERQKDPAWGLPDLARHASARIGQSCDVSGRACVRESD